LPIKDSGIKIERSVLLLIKPLPIISVFFFYEEIQKARRSS